MLLSADFPLSIPIAAVFTMAMDIANGERSILDWDEDQVHRWLSGLGFSQYEAQIKGATRLISASENR